MEKDPHIVAERARRLEDENWRFRTYVKHSGRLDRGRVNAMARQFGQEAESRMECLTCGACCRDNTVPVSVSETRRLAKRLGISSAEFESTHLQSELDGEPAIDAHPCPFLDGNTCSVYDDRPKVCRGYPYVGGDVPSRMVGIIERAETCPIIFHMLERLKDALGFRRYR
jgi:Fe-S-cluster containining protein